MHIIALHNQTKERPQLPPKMSSSGYTKRGRPCVGHNNGYLAMSPQSRPCSNRSASVRCVHCGYVVAREMLKNPQGNKEVLRRALAPSPRRRKALRWLNFRPTPSRLSNMSMA